MGRHPVLPARRESEPALKVLFAGTPAPAVPSLEALLGSDHEVVAVLTRPDARSGRGRKVSRSPVAARADAAGIPVLQPRSPREPEFLTELADLAVDCAPVVAYGALVPQVALDLPRHGWVNLHFSLLPAWRGAAPVQHAIMAGDELTGAATFRLEAGLDTGPVFGIVTEPIGPRDTAGDLLARLALSGAGLLVATLDGIEVLKPKRAKDEDFVARLTELAPDCCPVVAYGALLPQRVLDIPTHGWVNLHFSLLPAWREIGRAHV